MAGWDLKRMATRHNSDEEKKAILCPCRADVREARQGNKRKKRTSERCFKGPFLVSFIW